LYEKSKDKGNYMKGIFQPLFIFLVTLALISRVQSGTPKWYDAYQAGLVSMEQKEWEKAINYFKSALKEKSEDAKKMRAFGTIFIEYFPHRETGICYFQLGQYQRAESELRISLKHSSSKKAENYLKKIQAMKAKNNKLENKNTSVAAIISKEENDKNMSKKSDSPLIGDRLSIAVLPFENQGLSEELGTIDLLDKLITVFVNLNRFKVIERASLEKVLEEQKLGISGIIDANTAAEIGKGIGVDAVVVGSVTRAPDAISIDARLIDTESAAIITAKDAYSTQISLQAISNMISNLATKIKDDLPIINGYVIDVSGEKLTLDIGRSAGIKKGMKCHVYREGESIIHPVTGKVIAKEINELCEVQLTDVFEAYSIADVTVQKAGVPQIRDKFVTK
jgi:TolB-like protein